MRLLPLLRLSALTASTCVLSLSASAQFAYPVNPGPSAFGRVDVEADVSINSTGVNDADYADLLSPLPATLPMQVQATPAPSVVVIHDQGDQSGIARAKAELAQEAYGQNTQAWLDGKFDASMLSLAVHPPGQGGICQTSTEATSRAYANSTGLLTFTVDKKTKVVLTCTGSGQAPTGIDLTFEVTTTLTKVGSGLVASLTTDETNPTTQAQTCLTLSPGTYLLVTDWYVDATGLAQADCGVASDLVHGDVSMRAQGAVAVGACTGTTP